MEERSIAFRDIEALVKILSDQGAIDRARRLRDRSGLNQLDKITSELGSIAMQKAEAGFEAFRVWAENPLQGLVLTAHPTFSLSRDIRDALGKIAGADNKTPENLRKKLESFPYLPERAPTLQEEHEDAQAALIHIQQALMTIYRQVLAVAKRNFPEN